MRASLTSVIDGSLINRFRGMASSGQSGSGPSPSALSTSGASSVSLSDGLRYGARTFVAAVKGLNSASALVQLSKDTLGGLEELTDKLINLSERAGESSTGQNQRANIDREFQKAAEQFQKIVENSKFGEREFLTTQGLSEIFQMVGLDRGQSDAVAKVFDEFVVPAGDDALASEEVRGDRPVKIPRVDGQIARLSKEFESLFSPDANIRNRGDAVRMTEDLKALKTQIHSNIEAVDDALGVLTDNLELVRATGLAFLGLSQSDSISSAATADEVASVLRDEIRRNAKPAYLAQAGNLESIVVAALALG